RLAQIDGQKAGDTIQHDLRRHRLQIRFQGREIPVEVATDDVLAAIIYLQLTDGGSLMLPRPDSRFGEHEKAVCISMVLEPARQGHAIICKLREVCRRRFTSRFDINNPQSGALISSSNDEYGAVRLDGPALASMGGNHANDVWSHPLQREGPAASDRTSIDEIGQVMRRNKARNNVVFDLQQKVVWPDVEDMIAQFDRIEDVLLALFEIVRLTRNHAVRENLHQFGELFAFKLTALLGEQTQAGTCGILQ